MMGWWLELACGGPGSKMVAVADDHEVAAPAGDPTGPLAAQGLLERPADDTDPHGRGVRGALPAPSRRESGRRPAVYCSLVAVEHHAGHGTVAHRLRPGTPALRRGAPRARTRRSSAIPCPRHGRSAAGLVTLSYRRAARALRWLVPRLVPRTSITFDHNIEIYVTKCSFGAVYRNQTDDLRITRGP